MTGYIIDFTDGGCGTPFRRSTARQSHRGPARAISLSQIVGEAILRRVLAVLFAEIACRRILFVISRLLPSLLDKSDRILFEHFSRHPKEISGSNLSYPEAAELGLLENTRGLKASLQQR